MKGFISWQDWKGEKSLPIAKIIKIGIEPLIVHKIDNRIVKRWLVIIEIDANNPLQREIIISYKTETEAYEFYNYCLKQIAEWQDKGGENG